MKKLSLDLEALAVESFDTTRDAAAGRGTVEAAEQLISRGTNCPECHVTIVGDSCASCGPPCYTNNGDDTCQCPPTV